MNSKSRHSKNKRELEQVQELRDDYLVNGTLPEEIIEYMISFLPKLSDKASLVKSCTYFHSRIQSSLNELGHKKLVQAVIDGDRKMVKTLLDSHPSLVLVTPAKAMVIKSKKTKQKFYIEEDVVTIAARRKQKKMIRLLLSYRDNLEQTDIVKQTRKKALSAWSFYEMRINEQGKEEIVIPNEYASYAQYLINVFREEDFSNGSLSERAESALLFLCNLLLPKKAIKLDDYLDPELFLLAIYKAYKDNIATFNSNLEQLDAFCILVIGLIQSVLTPETAEIFCEGFSKVMSAKEKGTKKKISQDAKDHKLLDGKPFYRSGLHDGIRSSYYVGIFGRSLIASRPWVGWRGCEVLEKHCQAKATSFRDLMKKPVKRSRCVIS